MRLTIPAMAALIFFTPQAGAQDFLRDLGRFVEDVLPERAPTPPGNGMVTPTRPAPPQVERPVAPSVPTPESERPAPAEEQGAPPLPRPRPEAADPGSGAADAEQAREPEETVGDGIGTVEGDAEAGRDAPERVYQTACPALLSGVVVGEMLDPIADGICGERSPLAISAMRVNGREIGFSSPVTTNCAMAGALADWVGEVDAYAGAALDSPVATVTTGTSMVCRNRNGGDESFLSEHGFANAVDVIGLTLADGRSISVDADWLPAGSAEGKLLRQAHGAACGRFTTVLGPEANAEHEDHFHLDLGCHGQSCTAQICE